MAHGRGGREWYHNAKFTCERKKRRGEIGGKKENRDDFYFWKGVDRRARCCFYSNTAQKAARVIYLELIPFSRIQSDLCCMFL